MCTLDSMHGMQIGVCYQLAFNTASFPNVCQARTRVHLVIGQWQLVHKLRHSQSIQPGFLMHSNPAGDPGGAGLGVGVLTGRAEPQDNLLAPEQPSQMSMRTSWARACAENSEMKDQ
jgi:hypothetical protein